VWQNHSVTGWAGTWVYNFCGTHERCEDEKSVCKNQQCKRDRKVTCCSTDFCNTGSPVTFSGFLLTVSSVGANMSIYQLSFISQLLETISWTVTVFVVDVVILQNIYKEWPRRNELTQLYNCKLYTRKCCQDSIKEDLCSFDYRSMCSRVTWQCLCPIIALHENRRSVLFPAILVSIFYLPKRLSTSVIKGNYFPVRSRRKCKESHVIFSESLTTFAPAARGGSLIFNGKFKTMS